MEETPHVTEVNATTFEVEVIAQSHERPVAVDFWADWCGPCKMIAPVVEELAEEYDGQIVFAKVDVDSSPLTAAEYGIRSIPTLLVFKDGSPVDQVVGAVPKAVLKQRLDSALA